MRESSTTDLVRKLLSIGIMLGMVSVSEMGSSTFAPMPMEEWTVSQASTYRTPQKPRAAEIELAVAEVGTARGILAAPELHRELAFGEYLSAVDNALNAYDLMANDAGKYVRLAAALAVARTTLLDGVARLSSWTAIARATGLEERFASIPDRFIAAPSALTRDGDLHPAQVLETWLDLESTGA